MTAANRQTIRAARDRETRERTAGTNGPQNVRALNGTAWPPMLRVPRDPTVFGAIRQYEGS